jgi:hypothetical protein
MLKKVGHIILSILLVVSTTGLTYTKHYCSAQSSQVQHSAKMEYSQKAHAHNYMNMKHDKTHEHTDKVHANSHSKNNLCSTQECNDDDNCCDNETCSNDNCCSNKTITVKLSMDYILIDSKEIFKSLEFELLNTSLVTSFNSLFIENDAKINRYHIVDSPHKIKNTPSILQNFLC